MRHWGSGGEQLSPEVEAGLNPGIVQTVRWLRALGFDTCDSGDGRTGEHACDRDYPYVVARVRPEAAVEEARRLAKLLRKRGLAVSTQGACFGGPGARPGFGRVCVQVTYDPADDIALLDVMGLDDSGGPALAVRAWRGRPRRLGWNSQRGIVGARRSGFTPEQRARGYQVAQAAMAAWNARGGRTTDAERVARSTAPVAPHRAAGRALTEEDVRAIRRRVARGERRADVAHAYALTLSAVGLIVTGKRWAHVPMEVGA